MRNESTTHIDGRKIKFFREQQKLTQLYLATSVGVTTETISRWENKTAPSIKKENVLRLAESLNVHIDDLQIENVQSPEITNNTRIQTGVDSKHKQPHKKQLYLLTGILLLTLMGGGLSVWLDLFPPKTQTKLQGYRYIPDHILPDQVFPVVIQVTRSGYHGSYMVREHTPTACTIIATTPEATTTESALHKIKWIQPADKKEKNTYIYSVKTNNSLLQETLLSFAGSFILTDPEEKTIEISGILKTKVSQYHWADTNRDNQIDDYEMLTVYDLLSEKQQVDINFLEIKAIWAARGYKWDETRGVLKILHRLGE